MDMTGIAIAMIGAGLAIGLPGVGSSIGMGYVGNTAAGLVSDEPEKFGKVLILQLLPGTQGIYGFVAFALMLMQLGALGGVPTKSIDFYTGVMYFAAALPIAIAGYFSAIHQGRTAAAGVSILAKRPEHVSKAIMMSALIETYAVFALVATILALQAIPK